MSNKRRHSLLTAQTASSQWKLVRKGVMPAFSPNNIRWAAGTYHQPPCSCTKWRLFLCTPMRRFLHYPCRQGFRHVLDIVGRLMAIMEATGSAKAVDMASLLKREALDVIGVLQLLSQPLAPRDSNGSMHACRQAAC